MRAGLLLELRGTWNYWQKTIDDSHILPPYTIPMDNSLLLYVAIGGAGGAVSRHLCNIAATNIFGHNLPYGTFSVNILGSLLMGILIGCISRYLPAHKPEIHALLAIGFLGSFTTFSSFALDAILMIERNQILIAIIYIIASVFMAILGLAAGLAITKLWN